MVRTYSYQLPTRIEFGNGVSRQVGVEAQALGAMRAMVITDPGVRAAGIVDPIVATLAEAGIDSFVFDAVASNPRAEQVDAAGAAAAAQNVDLLIAVGGGSPIDTAKGAGVVQTHGGKITDWEGWNIVSRPITPLIAIPTTAGTGSEVSFWAVITDTARHYKMSVASPLIAPRVALLDPELTLCLPKSLTASTGMDALSHSLEAYTAAIGCPLADALAVAGLEACGRHLRRACEDGGDLEARYGMMYASMVGLLAVGGSDVAGVHCMGEAVGGLYDIPHGVAMAIYLPVVTEYNLTVAPDKYSHAARLLGEDVGGLSVEEAAAKAVDALRKLNVDLGIPSAADVGVKRADFARLAKAASINLSASSNPRPAGEEEYYRLFELAGGR
jgi:alcohol dehydrogenase